MGRGRSHESARKRPHQRHFKKIRRYRLCPHNCGKHNDVTNNYCHNCGRQLLTVPAPVHAISREEAERLVKAFQLSCYCFSDACGRGIDSELDAQNKIMMDAEAALLSRLCGETLAPLTWTKEKPTKPGWYWHRTLPGYVHEPIWVGQENGILKYWHVVEECWYELPPGEWAGPIPEPQAPDTAKGGE